MDFRQLKFAVKWSTGPLIDKTKAFKIYQGKKELEDKHERTKIAVRVYKSKSLARPKFSIPETPSSFFVI